MQCLAGSFFPLARSVPEAWRVVCRAQQNHYSTYCGKHGPDLHWCCPLAMCNADLVRISASQSSTSVPSGKRASPHWVTSTPSQRNISTDLKGRSSETAELKKMGVLHQVLKTYQKSFSCSVHTRGYTWTGSSAAKCLLAHCQSLHILLLFTFLSFAWKRLPVNASSVCESADLTLLH